MQPWCRLVRELRDGARRPDFPKPEHLRHHLLPVIRVCSPRDDKCIGFAGQGVTHVAAIERRGLSCGGQVARVLGAGFIRCESQEAAGHDRGIEYAFEYGSDRLEVHVDVSSGTRRRHTIACTGGTARRRAPPGTRWCRSTLGAHSCSDHPLGGRRDGGRKSIPATLTKGGTQSALREYWRVPVPAGPDRAGGCELMPVPHLRKES